MNAKHWAMLAAATALGLGATLLARTWTSGGALPRPAPARAEGFSAPRRNAECEACHADIAREWRGSQHQTSFEDPTFQRAFAVEPTAFCRGCHAPEDPALAGSAAAATEIGVACVTCHLAGDAVLAAPSDAIRLVPHRFERAAAFASPQACAGCHEFSFGDDERREAPLGMQRTVSEHAASRNAEQSCASCHMPLVGEGRARHRSHEFASTRLPEAHRRSLSVTATRVSSTSLRLSLATNEVGHAYPTGDLFRRVAVVAEVVGDEQRSLVSRTRYLGRHFGSERAGDGRMIRVEERDDRIGVGSAPTEVELDLGAQARGKTIVWSVALERVLHQQDGLDPLATVEDSIVLAEGSVAE